MFTIDDVANHKSVNGVLTLLTEQERQAIADEWNAAQPKHADLVRATLSKAGSMRMEIFRVLDRMHLSAITNATMIDVNGQAVTLASAIESSKQALRDITETVDLSQCATRQEMEAVVLQAYYAIVTAAPPEIKSAFDSLKP